MSGGGQGGQGAPGNCPTLLFPSAPSSVFHHIFGAVIDWFSSKFSAEGLPVPRLWSDVSDGHLKLMHSTMADLHSKADERYVDFSKLPVDRSSWDLFLDKTMLNDECVDWMAKMLCQAVGSTMPGAETETVSPMLEISTNHSGRYVVLGVLHAEMLRRVVLGRSEDLTPVLRTLVGKRNVGEALARRLDPFSSKDLLVLKTWGKHTSLVELTRSRSSVDRGWSLCIHDTNNGHPTLDSDLNKGINLLLNGTGPKRAVAILLGLHPRAGASSALRVLHQDAVRPILRIMWRLSGPGRESDPHQRTAEDAVPAANHPRSSPDMIGGEGPAPTVKALTS